MYLIGLVYSLLIWTTAEGFGGPYTGDSTDPGAAIAYVVVFASLYLIDDLAGRSPLALDSWIEARFPWWARLARTERGAASG
jgi:nitrite reductase (NO-forming)